MRTISTGDTLVFIDFENLSGPTAGLFREFLRATLKPEHRYVEIDLQRATFMDSEGLGAVLSAPRAVAVTSTLRERRPWCGNCSASPAWIR